MLFDDINSFFAINSYGPIAAIVCDIGPTRYCIIQPFNYYVIFKDKAIYLLLPPSMKRINFTCINIVDSLMAAKFTENGLVYVCVNASFDKIYSIFRKNAFAKIVITREIKFLTIIALLNKCIDIGIFTF